MKAKCTHRQTLILFYTVNRHQLRRLTSEQISEHSRNLIRTYPEDIDGNIVSDVIQFHAYVKGRALNLTGMKNTTYSHQDLYDIIIKDGMESKALFQTLTYSTVYVSHPDGNKLFW